jgi:hypothetical protein
VVLFCKWDIICDVRSKYLQLYVREPKGCQVFFLIFVFFCISLNTQAILTVHLHGACILCDLNVLLQNAHTQLKFHIHMIAICITYIFQSLPVVIFCCGTVAPLFRHVINNESDLLVDDDNDQTLEIEVIVQRNVVIAIMMNKKWLRCDTFPGLLQSLQSTW